MCRVVKPLVAESSYNMLARSHFEPALKAFHSKRNFYHGILIALHHEPDIARRAFTLSHGSCFDSCSSTAVELPVGSGCHEGTQDQADQIPNVTSQDRTSRIRKASAVIRHHHGAYHARIVSNKDIFPLCIVWGATVCRNLKSHPDCARMWYLYRPSIFAAGWWPSLMSLSGPEQSASFDLFLNFAKDIIPRTLPSDSLPWLMIYLVKCNRFFVFLVQRERINFPPLHLPSVKMVEIKARAWSQTVVQLSPLF